MNYGIFAAVLPVVGARRRFGRLLRAGATSPGAVMLRHFIHVADRAVVLPLVAGRPAAVVFVVSVMYVGQTAIAAVAQVVLDAQIRNSCLGSAGKAGQEPCLFVFRAVRVAGSRCDGSLLLIRCERAHDDLGSSKGALCPELVGGTSAAVHEL